MYAKILTIRERSSFSSFIIYRSSLPFMSTILLTGGRAPATLELARLFKRAGHRVIAADSVPHTLCSRSRAVESAPLLPAPKQRFAAFCERLGDLIEAEEVDLLVPTCEELFYVAMAAPQLRERSKSCALFLPTLSQLRTLHSKAQFIEQARAFGLSVPDTERVTGSDRLEQLCRDRDRFRHGVVLKPEFSRFATRTLIRPSAAELKRCLPTAESPWVVQAYLPGRHFATYSLVQAGRVVAHSDYAIRFTAGGGAAVAFQPLRHAAGLEWVAHFAARSGVTGQLAFDFIEHEGEVLAIECNPRLTSGIHLFYDQPELVERYFLTDGGEKELLQPHVKGAAALWLPLWFNGPACIGRGEGGDWLQAVLHSRNILFEWGDLRPWLGQPRTVAAMLRLAREHGRGLIDATTADIEWNGEMML